MANPALTACVWKRNKMTSHSSYPVINCKSSDLKRHRDHVDGAVQQVRLKFLLQVYLFFFPRMTKQRDWFENFDFFCCDTFLMKSFHITNYIRQYVEIKQVITWVQLCKLLERGRPNIRSVQQTVLKRCKLCTCWRCWVKAAASIEPSEAEIYKYVHSYWKQSNFFP